MMLTGKCKLQNTIKISGVMKQKKVKKMDIKKPQIIVKEKLQAAIWGECTKTFQALFEGRGVRSKSRFSEVI